MSAPENPYAVPVAVERQLWPIAVGSVSMFVGFALTGCYGLGLPFTVYLELYLPSDGHAGLDIAILLACFAGALLALPAGLATLLRHRLGRLLHLVYAVVSLIAEAAAMISWIAQGNDAVFGVIGSAPIMVWPAICLVLFTLAEPTRR